MNADMANLFPGPVMAGLTRHPLKNESHLSGDCGSSLRYARNDKS